MVRTTVVIDVWPPADQAFEMIIDGLVAFAAGVAQRLHIEDMDAAAAVIDEPGLLQLPRHDRDAAALHAEHLRQKLLRERKGVAHEQVAASASANGTAVHRRDASHCRRRSAGYAHR